MKYICKVEAIEAAHPEYHYIPKKQVLTQAFILDFLSLPEVTDAQRIKMKETIVAARAANEHNFMTQVRDTFLEMFFEEQDKGKKTRLKMEDKIHLRGN